MAELHPLDLAACSQVPGTRPVLKKSWSAGNSWGWHSRGSFRWGHPLEKVWHHLTGGKARCEDIREPSGEE